MTIEEARSRRGDFVEQLSGDELLALVYDLLDATDEFEARIAPPSPPAPRWQDTHIVVDSAIVGRSVVNEILNADVDQFDGREPWQVFRMLDGSLIFGCYPMGLLYESIEDRLPV